MCSLYNDEWITLYLASSVKCHDNYWIQQIYTVLWYTTEYLQDNSYSIQPEQVVCKNSNPQVKISHAQCQVQNKKPEWPPEFGVQHRWSEHENLCSSTRSFCRTGVWFLKSWRETTIISSLCWRKQDDSVNHHPDEIFLLEWGQKSVFNTARILG